MPGIQNKSILACIWIKYSLEANPALKNMLHGLLHGHEQVQSKCIAQAAHVQTPKHTDPDMPHGASTVEPLQPCHFQDVGLNPGYYVNVYSLEQFKNENKLPTIYHPSFRRKNNWTQYQYMYFNVD